MTTELQQDIEASSTANGNRQNMVPKRNDIPVKNCQKMTDEQLMQAILNSGVSTTGGHEEGGTK